MATKVMLVDDHQLVRDGLVRLLSREQDLEVVGAAADAPESLLMVRVARPDVVLMDIDLPEVDGITATWALRELCPAVKVVMLSASCRKVLVRRSAEAGACGYLLKGDPPAQLCEGIRAAARGDHPMAPQVRALFTVTHGALEGTDRAQNAFWSP